MRPLPTAPSADDEISASFIRSLVECIKERTILNAPGYRTKTGPNGTTLAIEPGKRSSSPAALSDNCCWRIASIDKETSDQGEVTKITVTFANRYFSIGGKLYQSGAATAVIQNPGTSTFVCVRIPSRYQVITVNPSIEAADSFEALVELARNNDYYTFPLYEISQGGSVVCDFRNMASNAMGEIKS